MAVSAVTFPRGYGPRCCDHVLPPGLENCNEAKGAECMGKRGTGAERKQPAE